MKIEDDLRLLKNTTITPANANELKAHGRIGEAAAKSMKLNIILHRAFWEQI